MELKKNAIYLFTLLSLVFTLLSPVQANETERYLFGTNTCFECAKVKEYFKEQQVAYTFIDIESLEGLASYNQVLSQYHIENAPSPMVLDGNTIYAGYDAIVNQEPYVPSSMPTNWITICLAGLVDGINPCAMSLLLFILALCFKYQLKLFKAMTLYILGIFSANYLIGVILVRGFSMLTSFAKYLYLMVIALSVGFLILSCFNKLDVTLGFNRLKKLLDKKPFYTTIFLAAFLVAILEFFCTSQVYLPSTLYIASLSNWWWFLFLYNLSFVVPLILLLGIAIRFYESDYLKVNVLLSKHQKAIKIASNIILLLLIIILISQYRRIF